MASGRWDDFGLRPIACHAVTARRPQPCQYVHRTDGQCCIDTNSCSAAYFHTHSHPYPYPTQHGNTHANLYLDRDLCSFHTDPTGHSYVYSSQQQRRRWGQQPGQFCLSGDQRFTRQWHHLCPACRFRCCLARAEYRSKTVGPQRGGLPSYQWRPVP